MFNRKELFQLPVAKTQKYIEAEEPDLKSRSAPRRDSKLTNNL